MITLGPVGQVAKRFLLHDPFNPVSLETLLLTAGWRLAAVYATLGLAIWGCLKYWRSLRVAGLFAAGTIPVMVLAIAWHGGSTDRYLPLFPLLAFAVAGTVEIGTRFRPYPVVLAGIAAAGISTVIAFSSARADRREAELVARLTSLPPGRWNDVLLFITTAQDPLEEFQRSYEGRAVRAGVRHPVVALIDPGGDPELGSWPARFARRALDAWPRDATVWISVRGLAPEPREEWEWVEEPDRGIRWKAIHDLLSGLEWGRRAGNEDGFVELLPSPHNRAALQALVDGG
jgi:hypothetical protein